jgi:hypothetical protein
MNEKDETLTLIKILIEKVYNLETKIDKLQAQVNVMHECNEEFLNSDNYRLVKLE